MKAKMTNIGGKQKGTAARVRRAFLPAKRNRAANHAPGKPIAIASSVLASDCSSVNLRLLVIVDKGIRPKKFEKASANPMDLLVVASLSSATFKKTARGDKEKISMMQSAP